MRNTTVRTLYTGSQELHMVSKITTLQQFQMFSEKALGR